MLTNRTSFLVSVLTLVLGLPLAAQVELVVNGDFENNNTNGWTFSGYTVAAQVSPFDTTGIGTSPCFNNRPGGQQTPSPYPPNSMEQPVMQIQGLEYLFTCDLAVNRIISVGNADAGTVEVLVDNVVVARKAFGSHVANTVKRERLAVVYTAPSSGSKSLKITFHRSFLSPQSPTSATPTVYIDNISLLMAPQLPVLAPRGERAVGGNLDLEMIGKPNAQFALFLALSEMPQGFSIPGFAGSWKLGVPFFQAGGSTFDAKGSFHLKTSIPNVPGLAGLPLHWQAIQASGPIVTIGTHARFGFY